MKSLYPTLLSLFFLPGLTSCNLNIPTENELTDPHVLTSVQSAYEALSTAYVSYPQEHLLLSTLADDYAPLSYARMAPDLISAYQWMPFQLEQYADRLWREYYHCVVNINAVLTRINTLRAEVSDEEKPAVDRIQAEAETLKAICYLDLIQLFATRYDDPYPDGILLKDHVEAEQLPRSTKAESVAEIRRLLESAHGLFERTKDLRPIHDGHFAFVSSSANAMALARLGLYSHDYEMADKHAKEVLATHPITAAAVPTAPEDWAKPHCSKIVLSHANSGPFYTENFISNRQLSESVFMLNPILNISQADLRHQSYVLDSISPTAGGVEILPILGKFNHPNLSNVEITQIPVMRPIEALFICAEAQVRLSKEEQARDLINEYLALVKAELIPNSIRGELLLERIMEEKHKEFSGENIRYYDLKRLRLMRETLGFNGRHQQLFISVDDYRWTLPIPKSEYRTNFALERQNPGWPDFERLPSE